MVFSPVFFNCYHYQLFIVGIFDFIVDCTFPGCCSMSPAFHHDLSGPHKHPPALSSTPNFFLLLFFAISFVFCFVFFFLLFVVFCYCSTMSATNFRECLLPSGIFHLTLISHIWCMYCHNLLLSRFSWALPVNFKSSRASCFNGLTTCCENYSC